MFEILCVNILRSVCILFKILNFHMTKHGLTRLICFCASPQVLQVSSVPYYVNSSLAYQASKREKRKYENTQGESVQAEDSYVCLSILHIRTLFA
jgi:hypothetical protein